MNPEDILTKNTAQLEAAEAELRAAQQRVDELRVIQEGMRLAIQRYGPATSDVPAAQDHAHVGGQAPKGTAASLRRPRRRSSKHSTRPSVNHSDLCLEILAESDGRPVAAAHVREQLRQRGHVFDAEQIRSAFAYLLRKERVVRVEAGVWALPSDHPGLTPSDANTPNGIVHKR